jgi:hypothetical protein
VPLRRLCTECEAMDPLEELVASLRRRYPSANSGGDRVRGRDRSFDEDLLKLNLTDGVGSPRAGSLHFYTVTLCRQPGSSIATPSRAKLFHEEPEAGNLHIRDCEG